ncbi:MAG: hypothetical protein CMJ18_06005 [Phycisphaeraceae bacterium]|nr:hypothetical protein [Phycisphaeraceae bacterium]
MHAGWNLLVKHGGDESVFLRRMMIVHGVAGLLPFVVAEFLLDPLVPTAWPFFLGSGACCGVYLLGLDRGYRATDFTVVYPVARAMPVLLVAVVEIPMGRVPTDPGWIGLILVAIGCVLAPLTSFGGFHPRAYLNRAVVWIVLAGLGTVGYSLIDNAAASSLDELDGLIPALRYGYWYFFVSAIIYLALARCVVGPPADDRSIGWLRPSFAAAMCFVGYSLIIWVYQDTEQVSYVVACRQFSIVIGVVAAFVIFRERGVFVRVTAAVLITSGMLVIAAWGQ